MPYSIRAGVRIQQNKSTRSCRIEEIPEPQLITLYADSVCVAVGDKVKKWQKIGEKDSLAVSAPLSGEISEISNGKIVLQNDFLSSSCDLLPVQTPVKQLESGEIAEILKNAGVYSGSTPAHKLICPAKRLIINLLESEPYLTALHRISLENTAEILNGAKLIMKACGIRRAVIAVEHTKHDVISALRQAIGKMTLFEIKVFKNKYPQDDPRQLIYALDGVEIPLSKPLSDEGYAVFDGFCCVETYRAFARGIPATTRFITVEGDCISTPKNLCVPIGTPFSHIIEYCGGLSYQPHKILDGGAMRGKAVYSADYPVRPDTKAVIALSDGFEKHTSTDCIRCGRCSSHCPMYLMPNFIIQGKAGGAENCIKCGVCSYICPANLPLTQTVEKLRNTALQADSNSVEYN